MFANKASIGSEVTLVAYNGVSARTARCESVITGAVTKGQSMIAYRMFDSRADEIASLVNDSNRTAYNPQAFSTGTLHLLTDGRAVEVSTDTRGCWIYGVHASLADALAYKKHQYESVRLEQF
jgi:nitrogen fixation protein FixH